MSVQVGEFDQGYGSIVKQGDGGSYATFKLGAHQNHVFSYVPKGIMGDNLFEIEVNLKDSGEPPVEYHQGQTDPVDLGEAKGVLLIALVDGKRKGTLITYHGSGS